MLDTAATIYPYARKKDWSQTFRVAAVLTEPVDPTALSHAIFDLSNRFPTFFVQLKQGVFWYKLRPVSNVKILIEDDDYPCRPLLTGKGDKPMFRVVYRGRRVAVELFHSVSDGSGALCFLKTLISRYYELLEKEKFPPTDGVLSLEDEPSDAEREDSFKENFTRKGAGISRSEAVAYQYEPPVREDYLKVMHGMVDIEALKKLTKEKGVTITEYLTALYIYSFYVDQGENKSKQPIKISVPMNMRSVFDSQTLRNFSLYVNVGINPQDEDFTFDRILEVIIPQFNEGKKKEVLQKMLNQNVHDSIMLAAKITPNLIKKPLLKLSFYIYGDRLFTSPFSNIGLVKVPEGMEKHIEKFEMVIGKTPQNTIYCTAASFKGIMNITFSSVSEEEKIQNFYFDFLREHGVDVKIEYEKV